MCGQNKKKTVCRKCEHFFFFCLDFYLPKKDEDEKTKVVWGKSECAPFSAAAAAESAADPYLRRRPHNVVQCPSPSQKLAVPIFLCEITIPPDLKNPPPFQKPRPSFTSLDRARRPNIKTCVSLENGPFIHRGSRDLGQVPYLSHPTVPCFSASEKCNTRGGWAKAKAVGGNIRNFYLRKK